jgi:pyridoxamine 5'-phosphate oxidase
VDERARPLERADLDPDPLRQFDAWYRDAHGVVRAPEAMAIATATSDGAPSARMVLMKGFDQRGFVFFTGYESRKGRELGANPRAALLFYWDPLGRQVRIEGDVNRVARDESDEYFHSRPRGAQLAALASRQSEVLPERDDLDSRYAELEGELDGREVPLPEAWGGYRLAPDGNEFCKHRENRMHDRFRYRRAGESWTIERLSP